MFLEFKKISSVYHTDSSITAFAPEDDWVQASQILEKKIVTFSESEGNRPPNCFGKELRSAYLLERMDERKEAYLKRFPIGRRPSIRRFFLRPAFEPIVCSYADEFRTPQYNFEAVEDIASVLFGRKRKVRLDKSTTKPRNGVVTKFPNPATIPYLWGQRNSRTLLTYDTPLAWALNRYLDFLQIHLFKDGNGRTARSLLLIDMAQALKIEVPYMPLGPFTYMYSSSVVRSYVAMMTSNDSRSFYWLMLRIINDALEFSEDV